MLATIAFLLSFFMLDEPPQTFGVALDPVTVYTGSTFEGKSLGYFKANEKIVILKSTADFREDEDQDLKFRWHKVKYKDHQNAWVFGGSVAVKTKTSEYVERHILDNTINLSGSYRQTSVDQFRLEGVSKKPHGEHADHDDDEVAEYESYYEEYLGFTNNEGVLQLIDIASKRPGGQVELADFYLEDVATIGGKEIILVKNNIDRDGHSSDYIQVFGMSTEEIYPIFEEKVTDDIALSDLDNVLIKKLYTIEQNFIYIEKPLLYDCEVNGMDMICLERESHAYKFNNNSHSFQSFYPASSSFLKGEIRQANVPFYKNLTQNKSTQLLAQKVEIVGLKPYMEDLFAFIKTENNGIGLVSASSLEVSDSNLNLSDIIDVMYDKSSDLFSENSAILQFR